MTHEHKLELIDNFLENILKPSFKETSKRFENILIKEHDNSENYKNELNKTKNFLVTSPLYSACINDNCSLKITISENSSAEKSYHAVTSFDTGSISGVFKFELKDKYEDHDKSSFLNILENSIKYLYGM